MQIRIPESYRIIEERALPDIHAEGIYLRHNKTGARILLLPCADDNRVFNIVFRTPPSDSTGVAHINEHCVLGGSRKYPLRDPFIELAKGSLNTFLNAITYPDKTMYPVASTNLADFRNLVDVYLDAVFYPNTYREERIFRQEGWSYHMDSADDELTVSGIVYNEMKGAFSSPEEVLDRQIQSTLFPDSPYGVESGGDPDHIPELTYEAFLAFHKRYYHPSNAYIFLYGDLDMEAFLNYLDEDYLSDFGEAPAAPEIPEQKPFAEMRRAVYPYPLACGEDAEEKAYLSWAAVLGDRSNIEEMIAVDVLDYALLSSPGAPIRKRLMEEGIGEDIYGGFSDGVLQPSFTVVAKNADAGDADRFLSAVREELEKAADEGIDKNALLAGLSNMEFTFREGDYGTIPKGLMCTIDVMDTWLYDDSDPFTPLMPLAAFASLKKHIEEDDGYFTGLIRRLFLENTHAALVVIVPEEGLQEKKDAELAASLAAKKAAMTREEIESIVRSTADLTEWHNTPDSPIALASLPVLRRSDLDPKPRPFSNIETHVPYHDKDGIMKEAKAVLHETESSGIAYLTLLFPADRIGKDELFALSLLRYVLEYMDTETEGYNELYHRINAVTGGISFDISMHDPAGEGAHYTPYFAVHMKALSERLPEGLALAAEILTKTRTDDLTRFREILMETNARISLTLAQAGHQTAMHRSLAGHTGAGAFYEETSGIVFARRLRDLLKDEDAQAETARLMLYVLRRLIDPERSLISMTGDKRVNEETMRALPVFLETLAANADAETNETLILQPKGKAYEAFSTAGQVQYVALSGNYPARYGYSGKMFVLRQILTYDYLWKAIRDEGNAYGCGVRFARNGSGVFFSFRDPHLTRTIGVFRAVPEWVSRFHADEDAMTKFVIGTFSLLDTPLTPSLYGNACLNTYLDGRTEEDRIRERQEILSVTDEDIRALAPMLAALMADASVCVVGSESVIAKDTAGFDTVENLL